MLRYPPPLLLCLFVSGCAFDHGHSHAESKERGSPDAAVEPGSKPKADEDLPAQIEAAEVQLTTARLSTRVTAFENEAKLESAERAVGFKRRGVERAELALAHFENVTRRDRLASSALGLDRAEHRRELAEDELRELQAMYAEEDLAQKTKELVLKRGRKSLEFSARDLELTAAKAAALESFELPKELDEKRHELAEARVELSAAERSLEKSRVEVEIAAMKARAAVVEAEHKLAKLRKKVDEKKGES